MAPETKRRWFWPLLLTLLPAMLGSAAWAADHYIDDRVESKIQVLVEKLDKIEKALIEIKKDLDYIKSP